jgi:hypothetical protein
MGLSSLLPMVKEQTHATQFQNLKDPDLFQKPERPEASLTVPSEQTS